MEQPIIGTSLTREEAKESINTSYDEDEHYENMDAIDFIYDDFESRTCENCICFKTPQYKSSFCDKINHVVPIDFGCNKFERKADV